jgi:RNA polymerase sigma-70 factor (ECF subfamily)
VVDVSERRKTDDTVVPATKVVRATEDFAAFYRREYRSIVGLAYVLSGSRSGAEELAQEAFAAAYRDWDRVARLDSPEAWVRRVVSNQSVFRFRRVTAEARALLRLGDRPTVPEFSPETVDLWQAVRRLPRRQAQAIALRYLLDLPVEAVAAGLGCSVETARTHLKRARATLSREVER